MWIAFWDSLQEHVLGLGFRVSGKRNRPKPLNNVKNNVKKGNCYTYRGCVQDVFGCGGHRIELCSPRKTTDECTCFLTGPRWRFIVAEKPH